LLFKGLDVFQKEEKMMPATTTRQDTLLLKIDPEARHGPWLVGASICLAMGGVNMAISTA
jgi:hypothetical protein